MGEVQIISATKGKFDITGRDVKKLKVAAYCRVSTDSDEQLNSYNSQVDYYTNLIKNNSDWEFVNVYADFGISGTQVKKRAEFQRMIQDAKNGMIDMIITKSISRFARNTIDTLKYVRELRAIGVAVSFEKENIVTTTENGETLLTILSSLAQGESESISQNTKMGLQMKAKKGELIGFNSCLGYGYDKETGSLYIVEEEAETVRYIFKRYIEGAGCHTIEKELQAKGILTPKGKTNWSGSTISKILGNEKYIGDILTGKTYTIDPITKKRIKNVGQQDCFYLENHHEPIITREQFEQAKILRHKRSRQYNQGTLRKYNTTYPFSNVMKCKYCGGTVIRRKGTSGKKDRFMWLCNTAAKKGKASCPNCKLIDEDVLENSFVQAFNKLCIDNEKIIQEFLDNLSKSIEYQEYENEVKALHDKINKAQGKRNQLIDLLLEEKIDKIIYEKKYKKLSDDIDELESELKIATQDSNMGADFKTRLESFKNIFSHKEPMEKFDGESFRMLIKEVIIGDEAEDGTSLPYTINFIFKTGLKINVTPLFPKAEPPKSPRGEPRTLRV